VRAAELRSSSFVAALLWPLQAMGQTQASWDGLGWPLAWIFTVVLGIVALVVLLFWWWVIPGRTPRPPGAGP
jgi:hypothetical protein